LPGKGVEAFVSVDIEASGPVPQLYSMLALGACLLSDRKKTFYVELKPITSAFIPEAMEVVGKPMAYFRRHGESARTGLASFGSWVTRACKDMRPVFVGLNAAFDWAFINWYFHRFGITNPFGIGGVDIKSYFMGLSGCAWEETRSSKIAEKLGITAVHTHNALDDAVEQAALFESLLHRARSRIRLNTRRRPC
jgi:ribonuclease T